MESVLEVQLGGWTATPRLPFVVSGNALCLPVPPYSLLLGLVGCCLGRLVDPTEVRIGFKYSFESVALDLETRRRLELDGKRLRSHKKGSDAYKREFHVKPQLTIWLDRTDWKSFFQHPVGTPSLGRSQDILEVKLVREVKVNPVKEAELSGCMLPFSPKLKIGGQLVQLAESFRENTIIGTGRTGVRMGIFLAVPHDNLGRVEIPSLYCTVEEDARYFYLHEFAE